MVQHKTPGGVLPGGVHGVLRVRVQPKASSNQVLDYTGDTLRLRVTSAPRDGKANAAVIALLAKELGIGKSKISIMRGNASRTKVLRVDALTTEEIKNRLGIEDVGRNAQAEERNRGAS